VFESIEGEKALQVVVEESPLPKPGVAPLSPRDSHDHVLRPDRQDRVSLSVNGHDDHTVELLLQEGVVAEVASEVTLLDRPALPQCRWSHSR
jgi:hypothetical protein